MAEAGVSYPRVEGGYKALRRHLIKVTERETVERSFVLLSGRTGSGKTGVIRQVPAAIDLEGLANHRGSSFGRHVAPQPAQIDFENALAVALLKHRHRTPGRLLLEDESRCIGGIHLPKSLFEAKKRSPLVVLEVPLEQRIDNVITDYVEGLVDEYRRIFGEESGFEGYGDHLLDALARIRKRLGGALHDTIKAMLSEALEVQARDGDVSAHRPWIALLLNEYYDPMYDYQLAGKDQPVLFRGGLKAVLEWFSEHRLS
jgi:tRNA 2-selenouridine synthase